MYLQLLVVFFVFLTTLKGQKHCGAVIVDQFTEPARFKNCEEASSVRIEEVLDWVNPTTAPWTLPSELNSVRRIRNDGRESGRRRPAPSLFIEHTLGFTYTPETFFPNLTAILPPKESSVAAILIRDNSDFCLPEEVKQRLLAMVDQQGYIAPCMCNVDYADVIVEGGETLSHTVGLRGEPNCTIVAGSLLFTEHSVMTKELRQQLASVTQVIGQIYIGKTNFTTLDFLKNLQKVFINFGDRPHNFSVMTITENRKLTTLGFMVDELEDRSKARGDIPLMRIEKNPLLKFTQADEEFIKGLAETDAVNQQDNELVHLEGGYCRPKYPIPGKNNYTVVDCTHIEGDLIIDESFNGISPGEMEDLFGFLRELRGCLTIRGTTFNSTYFLHDLKRIECDRQRPAVVIEENPNLLRLDFQVNDFGNWTQSSTPIWRIANNSKLCPSEVEYLESLMEFANKSKQIEYDGRQKRCQLPANDYPEPVWYFYVVGLSIILVGVLMMELVLWKGREKREKTAELLEKGKREEKKVRRKVSPDPPLDKKTKQ